MNRNLDGSFFRVKRNGKWVNLCLSDMTTEERMEVMKNRDTVFLTRLCNCLADALKEIGEEFNIVRN